MPKVYRLPQRLRRKLAKPMGTLYTPEEMAGATFDRLVRESPMVITVGDRVTETMAKIGRTPEVQVVDAKENRKERAPPEVPYARLIRVANPAGTLSAEAIKGVRDAFTGKKPVRILVDGEEDLVAIPVIAMAPITAVVFYGQPGQGIVAVRANARAKSRNRGLLAEMGAPEIR